MPNFMLQDLAGCLKAVYLLPLFLLFPGYTIAWLCGLFDFRGRTGLFRLVFSVPFSIAVCPIVTFLLGRFAGMSAVWAFYGAAALGFAAIQLTILRAHRPRRSTNSRDVRIFGGIVAAWLVVCLVSLVDLQIGGRLYYSNCSLDGSVRTAFVQSISATGIPPRNPLFNPPQPVPLRYHYFWLMMCSLVEQAGNHAVAPRQALVAGAFWCGLGLMAMVALYLRLFSPADPARFRKRALTAVLLLGITGLDILPGLCLLALYAKGALPFVLPSIEWWNEHVDWFVYTTLWAPHALAGLLAGLMGFLLLWRLPEERGPSGFLRYGLLAGAALATSIGASIYVAFVFAVFLAVWMGITVWKRWRRETAGLALAGTVCAALALPFLLSLRGPAAAGFGGAPPIQFTVREFSLAALVPRWPGMSDPMQLLLIKLPLIPLNYFIELGLFFLVGTIQWRKLRRRGGPLSRHDLACAAMALTSILICTFLRSSVIGPNDLGWRGFLPAEFVLLLWAVDIVSRRNTPGFLTVRQRSLVVIFLFLGALGSVFDLALNRAYPILADRGVIPPLEWMSPDRHFGERTYAMRQAYEWAGRMTPETAVIQYNPHVAFEETTALLYGNRRAMAADMQCNASFGGDPRICAPIVSQLVRVYPPAGQAPTPDLREVCSQLPIDLLVAKDTDPVWKNPASWVWTQKAVYSNRYVRLFSCGDNGPRAQIP